MSEEASFQEQMLQDRLIELSPDDPLSFPCEYAKSFVQDCEELEADLEDNLNDLTVYAALLQLQRKYFFWYETAPPVHREHVGTRDGHTCIHQVYLYFYRRLDRKRGALNPPLLRAPPSQPQSGTLIGLMDDEE